MNGIVILSTIFSALSWRPAFNDNDFSGWLVTTAYLAAVISCFVISQKTRMRQAALKTSVPAMEPGLRETTAPRPGGDEVLNALVRSPEFSRIWSYLALLLLFLGINQQLDLQTLLIQSGRALAEAEGWYPYRRLVQRTFFGLFAVGTLLLVSLAAWRCRVFLNRHRLVTLGLAILIGFVLMRAADFNHVWLKTIQVVHEDFWKNFLELLGLGLIAAGARRASKISS